MELTIDDCLAIAGRESATEAQLRAAVCVAVGQALHYRYEARGYSDAAETAKRDADRARAETERLRDEVARLLVRDDLVRALATYTPRRRAPTDAEQTAHAEADGAWLVMQLRPGHQPTVIMALGAIDDAAMPGTHYLPLGADRLPCAWPVAP